MTRLEELQQRYIITQKQIKALNDDYVNRIKGEAYLTRYHQLVDKMSSINQQVKDYGTNGIIIKVKGKRDRIGKRNPQLRVTENFELYLINVDLNDIGRLISIKFKNIVSYSISSIKPGEILIK